MTENDNLGGKDLPSIRIQTNPILTQYGYKIHAQTELLIKCIGD